MSDHPPTEGPQRLWTLDFVLNLLTAHFLFAGFSSLFTVVPSFVLDLGGEEWQIGVVVGSFGAVSLAVRPLAGRWIYYLGAKRVAFAGAALFGIASLLYIPASSVWWLIPVRMLQGIGLGMAPVATTTVVANLAPITRRGEGMAYMGNSIAIGSLYAPVLAFWLMTHYGATASFLYSASSALMGSLMVLGISSTRSAVPTSEAPITVPLVSRRALFPTAVFLSYTITVGPISTLLPLLAEDRGLGNPGRYFTVYSFTAILTLLVSGHVADRWGRAAAIIPGLLTTASSMFLLTAASNQPMFLAAGLLTGAGFGLLLPGIQSLTVDRVAPRERSAAVATFQSAWDIGGSGGAFVLGPLGGPLGVAVPFGIAGAVTLLGAAGFVVGKARSPAVIPTGAKGRGSDEGPHG